MSDPSGGRPQEGSRAWAAPSPSAGLVVVIGGLGVMVGLVLPWIVMSVPGSWNGSENVSENAFANSSIAFATAFGAVGGLLTGGVIVRGGAWQPVRLVAAVASLVTFLAVVLHVVAAWDSIVSIRDLAIGIEIGLGFGAYVALGSAVVMLVGAAWSLWSRGKGERGGPHAGRAPLNRRGGPHRRPLPRRPRRRARGR